MGNRPPDPRFIAALSGADLSNADFRGTWVSATLSEVRLPGVMMDSQTRFKTNQQFDGADLRGARLSCFSMRYHTLKDADLGDAVLVDCELRHNESLGQAKNTSTAQFCHKHRGLGNRDKGGWRCGGGLLLDECK